jgi:tetratricopeptide (TPR) repeat protein
MAESAKERARALMAVGRNAEAIDALGSAIAAQPQDADLHCMLGLALLRAGKPAESLKAARAAAALAPDREWPFRVMAFALIRLRKPKEALAAAEQALRLDPMEELVLHVTAEAQLACGKTAEAEATASRMLELYPASSSAFDLRGRALMGRKQYAEAEASMREALRLDPDDWTLNNNLGVVLGLQKRKKEAIQAFERAAIANPSAKLPRQNLFGAANSYARVGGLLFAAYLVVRLTVVLGNSAHLSNELIFAIAAGAAGALLAAGWYIRRRRLQQLGPKVEGFLQHERPRYRNLGLIYLAFRLGPLLIAAVILLILAIAQPNPGDFSMVLVGGIVAVTAWFVASPFIWRRNILPRLRTGD